MYTFFKLQEVSDGPGFVKNKKRRKTHRTCRTQNKNTTSIIANNTLQGNFLCVFVTDRGEDCLTIECLSILQCVRFVVCVDYKDRVREESAR